MTPGRGLLWAVRIGSIGAIGVLEYMANAHPRYLPVVWWVIVGAMLGGVMGMAWDDGED